MKSMVILAEKERQSGLLPKRKKIEFTREERGGREKICRESRNSESRLHLSGVCVCVCVCVEGRW